MQKAAAKVFFGKDISSSYSEALKHFTKAAEGHGKPWNKNSWMIAQCLVKSKSGKDVAGAKAIMQKILASDDADIFKGEIAEFCAKKKIQL